MVLYLYKSLGYRCLAHHCGIYALLEGSFISSQDIKYNMHKLSKVSDLKLVSVQTFTFLQVLFVISICHIFKALLSKQDLTQIQLDKN